MCSECNRVSCSPRCPNAKESKSKYTCSICEEPILNGEEYIVSDSEKYAHWECFSVIGSRDLLNFLEFTIQTMEDD